LRRKLKIENGKWKVESGKLRVESEFFWQRAINEETVFQHSKIELQPNENPFSSGRRLG